MSVLLTLRSGGIILFPTDTLYGLGVDATNPVAIRSLKELKGRDGEDEKKPISIVVSDMAMAEHYATITPLGRSLADKFLPGALTLVLAAKETLPEELTAGSGTIGIRIPAHEGSLKLVREFGKPITATSANVAGMESERSVPKILIQFGDRATMITGVIDEGELPVSQPSTVVDARGERPVIVREGRISTADIESVV